MDLKQKTVIISPLLIMIVMYPVFQSLSVTFHDNWRIGWFLGLAIYWVGWCLVYPLLIIGKRDIMELIRPQSPNIKIMLLVLFPIIMTSIFRFIPFGTTYEKPDLLILVLIFSSTIGNGIFEEIYWRGVYMKLFPNMLLLRIVWPNIWFGLWHYAPGSINPQSGHVLGLIIGALFLGFYSSLLAKKTNTLWWSIIVHILGGMIMVV